MARHEGARRSAAEQRGRGGPLLQQLRQRQRGIVAWLLPTLLLAWNVAAAGSCAHAFAQEPGRQSDNTRPDDRQQPAVAYGVDAHGDHHAAPSHAPAHATAHHDEHPHSGLSSEAEGHHAYDGHGHDAHEHTDDCAQYCMHCAGQGPLAPVQSMSFCGDPLPDHAIIGPQSQTEPDSLPATLLVPESAFDPAASARVDPPTDAAGLAEHVPIHLRHCVFLN